MFADMVVSGIPVATPFHAREVADMAIDLVQACTVFSIPHMPAEPLKIRVGLHSGKIALSQIKNFWYKGRCFS